MTKITSDELAGLEINDTDYLEKTYYLVACLIVCAHLYAPICLRCDRPIAYRDIVGGISPTHTGDTYLANIEIHNMVLHS